MYGKSVYNIVELLLKHESLDMQSYLMLAMNNRRKGLFLFGGKFARYEVLFCLPKSAILVKSLEFG